MVRKATVVIYIAFLGFSYLQILWFFGYFGVGGFVLTPSSHPYIPPFSLVVTVPSNDCNGWAVKLVEASWLWGFKVYIPVVHYFAVVNGRTYEYFNYYVITDNVVSNIANYFYRLIEPKWIAMPYSGTCVAKVVLVVPAPIVLFIMVIALATKIYYKGRRVW